MPGLKITLLQQPLVWMDGPANLRHFDRQLEGITGRDVIVLPEMFTSGFAMEAAASSLAQDDVVNWMTAKAQQCNALIAGSVALQTESGSVNRFLLVEPGGTVHFYDKRHLFRMADEPYQVMSACKPHDCGSQRIAVMWSEKSNQMTGLFSTIDEKTSQEKLTWLNVNDALSIDGKTVLFAALTGSLENHPDGFNFK